MKQSAERQSRPIYAPNLRALAEAVGRSLPSLYRYRERGMPWRRAKCGWNVETIRRWINANAPDRREPTAEDLVWDERKRKAETLKLEHQAALLTDRLRRERAAHMHISEIEERDEARVAVVRKGLLGFPRTVAAELDGRSPAEIERILVQHVRRLLVWFSKQ